MRSRTIIYTDYSEILRMYIPNEEYAGIALIRKRDSGSSAEKIVNMIERIEREVLASKAAKEAKGDE